MRLSINCEPNDWAVELRHLEVHVDGTFDMIGPMFLIPIGQKDATMRRIPYVGLALLVVNLLVHFLLSGAVETSNTELDLRIRAIVFHLRDNPELAMPDDTESSLLNAAAPRIDAAARQSRRAPSDGAGDGDSFDDAEVAEVPEARLAELIADFVKAQDDHPYFAYALVPASPKPVSFIAHMFMHGGWLHLIANCLFLYALGLLLENTYGHMLFATLYLVTGFVAAMAHILSAPDSTIPMLGASGAISGVMGAFLVRLPMARVSVLWSVFFLFWGKIVMRGWLLLGIWITFQVMAASDENSATSGVAVWAHIGGFIAGLGFGGLVEILKLEPQEKDAEGNSVLGKRAFKHYDNALHHLQSDDLDAALRDAKAANEAEPGHVEVMQLLFQIQVRRADSAATERAGTRLLRALLERGDARAASHHWLAWRRAQGAQPQGPTQGAGPAVLAGLRFRLAQLVSGEDPALSRQLLVALAGDSRAGAIQEKAAALVDDAPTSLPLSDIDAPTGLPLSDIDAPTSLPLSDIDAPTSRQSSERLERMKVMQRGIVGLDQDTLQLSEGRRLAFLEILGVTAGWVAPDGDAQGQGEAPVIYLDLVIGWPGRAGFDEGHLGDLIRIPSAAMDPRGLLQTPDVAPMAAFAAFVAMLASRSGAARGVTPAADGTGVPTFTSIAELEAYFYGADAPPWTQAGTS